MRSSAIGLRRRPQAPAHERHERDDAEREGREEDGAQTGAVADQASTGRGGRSRAWRRRHARRRQRPWWRRRARRALRGARRARLRRAGVRGRGRRGVSDPGTAAVLVEKLAGAAGLTMRSQPSNTKTEFQMLPLVEPIGQGRSWEGESVTNTIHTSAKATNSAAGASRLRTRRSSGSPLQHSHTKSTNAGAATSASKSLMLKSSPSSAAGKQQQPAVVALDAAQRAATRSQPAPASSASPSCRCGP